jgi:alkanesulfonate monooxygenase SsuD/methylene tetrahydromethanopterin reductase-like flavin-dependent oxidoreductase (luciferase family)
MWMSRATIFGRGRPRPSAGTRRRAGEQRGELGHRVLGALRDLRVRGRSLRMGRPGQYFGALGRETVRRLRDLAEPLASTRERITRFRAQAAAFGRVPGFNVSVRPIIADTEGAAWDKANRILGAMNQAKGWRRQEEATGPVDNAGKRLMGFALESDIHDERL